MTGYSLTLPTDPSLFEIAGLEETMDNIIGDIRDPGKSLAGFLGGKARDSISSGSPVHCTGIL